MREGNDIALLANGHMTEKRWTQPMNWAGKA